MRIINEVKASGQRGRGGAGFADRTEMVVHAQAGRTAAALPRRQCRRVRARHLQGPRGHAPRPASADRRLPDRRLRHGARTTATSTSAANSSASASGSKAAVQQAYEAKLIGKNNIHGCDFDIVVHHGAGAYICGEETALLESLEGKKGHAAAKAAVPGQYGPLWLSDHRQQCRDHRAGAGHHAARRGVVRRHRAQEQHRHQAVSAFPATSSGRAMSKRIWAFRCAS